MSIPPYELPNRLTVLPASNLFNIEWNVETMLDNPELKLLSSNLTPLFSKIQTEFPKLPL